MTDYDYPAPAPRDDLYATWATKSAAPAADSGRRGAAVSKAFGHRAEPDLSHRGTNP
jgi:hypothetical protein